jgi:branched-chain amino acid transport system permease protein
MPDLKPFIILGLALGGMFAMSGVGLVVLFRATGVLNLAYGAVGGVGALIAWTIAVDHKVNQWLACLVCILFAGLVTLAYGAFLGPLLAGREPLVKASATLGLMLIAWGGMQWKWGATAHNLVLPTSKKAFAIGAVQVSWTQVIGTLFPIALTVAVVLFLTRTKLGTGMRALANDRDTTAMLGVPVRRVEAAAWFGSGLICGLSALLLSQQIGLDINAHVTGVISAALAAAVIGRLESLWITLVGGFVIGIVQSCATAFDSISEYRTMTPFVLAIPALLFFAGRQSAQRRIA